MSPLTDDTLRTQATSSRSTEGRVLLVDDEQMLLAVGNRFLRRLGYEVDVASDGRAAIELLGKHRYDVVLSDISMPGLDGMQLLRAIRERHLDVPVVLMTGDPQVETAIQAIELGALRYLTKPVKLEDLERVVRMATRLERLAALRRETALLMHREAAEVESELDVRFSQALQTLTMAFQPIVSWRDRNCYAFEALMRPKEPTLNNPGLLLQAAERLGRIHELGRVVRSQSIDALPEAPEHARLFINLHPQDLSDETLYAENSALAAAASRVTLEITERASLHEIPDVHARIARLRSMGFRVALDDFGAGYAGLSTFAMLEPELVKIDMDLVRGIDTSPTRKALVRGIISLCADLKIEVVAEGIETAGERDALLDLGVNLFQGYLFAKPGPAFPTPRMRSFSSTSG